MLLRDHPLFSYRGVRSWPPTWTWTRGLDNTRPRGEIGILREVVPSHILPADRCFLYIAHEGSEYIGCFLFADTAFCDQIVKLLRAHRNRPVSEIGNIDLKHTL